MNFFYSILQKIEKVLEKVVLIVSALGMAGITVIIFIQVIFRYVLGNSLSWSEELARYMEVWVVFLASGYALGKGQHIYMDLFVSHLPTKIKFIIQKFIAVLCFIFGIVCTQYSYILMQSEIVQRWASFNLPKWYVYLALIVGSVIMSFYALMLIFEGNDNIEKNKKEAEVTEA